MPITYSAGTITLTGEGAGNPGGDRANGFTCQDMFDTVGIGNVVVFKQGDNQFFIDANLGFGFAQTWFVEKNTHIEFGLGKRIVTSIFNYFVLGEEDNPDIYTGKNGCSLIMRPSSAGQEIITQASGTGYEFYDTTLHIKSANNDWGTPSFTASTWNPLAKLRFWGSRVIGSQYVQIFGDYPVGERGIARSDFQDMNKGLDPEGQLPESFYYDMRCIRQGFGIWFFLKNGSTLKDMSFYDCPILIYFESSTGIYNLINFQATNWVFQNISTCIVNRKYTFNLKMNTEAGVGIPTAQVAIWDDDDDEKVNTATDGDGVLAEQELVYGYYDLAGGLNPTMKTPHIMKVYKYGKQISKSNFSIDDAFDWILTMYDNDYITEAVEAIVAAYTGITVNHTTGTITISEDHTIAEIYDYLQYDIKENPQLAIDETMETADGVNFTSQYDFVINDAITVSADGKKLTMITGKTYTLTGTANFTGIIADQMKSRVPLVLKSIIDGSRYRIEKTSDGSLIAEGTQSGSGDIRNYYERTATVPSTIKVRKGSAAQRYLPYEAYGDIEDVAFTLVVSQVEDDIAS